MNFVAFLIVGALAGWLASKILKGKSFGLVGNLVVGILGSMIGGFVASSLGLFAGSLVGHLVVATGGAILLLYLLGLASK